MVYILELKTTQAAAIKIVTDAVNSLLSDANFDFYPYYIEEGDESDNDKSDSESENDSDDGNYESDSDNESSEEELTEFLDSLDHHAFEKIQKFFDTMPKLYHELHYKNELGNDRTITLDSVKDFFTLG